MDNYLSTYISSGTFLILYADNCRGQNKNQILIGYLSYLVKVKQTYPEIDLYFLIVGHTKFAPDSNFGNIKQKLAQSQCESILDLLGDTGLVGASAKNNTDIPYIDRPIYI